MKCEKCGQEWYVYDADKEQGCEPCMSRTCVAERIAARQGPPQTIDDLGVYIMENVFTDLYASNAEINPIPPDCAECSGEDQGQMCDCNP